MKVTEHPLYQQRREKLDLLEKRILDVKGQMYVDKIYFGGHDSMTLKDSKVSDSGVFLDGGPWESLKKSLKVFDHLLTGGAGGKEKN